MSPRNAVEHALKRTRVQPPPLLDLLGASFVFSSPINTLAWDGSVACLGLADGAIVMLHARWPGAPTLAHRPCGGVEIRAGEAPPPPPTIIAAHRDAVLSLASLPSGGIVSGGADGRFLHIANGEIKTIADHPRKTITHVGAGRGGRCAMVAGRQVDMFGPDARRIAMPTSVRALAYDPPGLNLAIGHGEGVMLAIAGVRRVRSIGSAEAAGRFAWSPDGTMLAHRATGNAIEISCIDTAALPRRMAQPCTPAAIGFSAEGTLIAAIDGTILCWPQGNGDKPIVCVAQSAGVTALACNPRRPIIAYGDALGTIFLCQPQIPGRMKVRAEGAAILHLAYAPDGESLVFATDDNEAGVVALPDILFRTGIRS